MSFGKSLIVLFAILIPASLYSQVILEPNYGLKSHETLEIEKVEMRRDATIVSFLIENRVDSGSFCVDRRTYLIDRAGNRHRMVKATGIPLCPANYVFKAQGEKRAFQLSFPPLAGEQMYINVVEECAAHCFSFYGVVLDEYINSRFDEAFSMAERGERARALSKFITISEVVSQYGSLKALSYYNIVRLAAELGDAPKAEEWYKKLDLMNKRDGKVYIYQLNSQGISY